MWHPIHEKYFSQTFHQTLDVHGRFIGKKDQARASEVKTYEMFEIYRQK